MPPFIEIELQKNKWMFKFAWICLFASCSWPHKQWIDFFGITKHHLNLWDSFRHVHISKAIHVWSHSIWRYQTSMARTSSLRLKFVNKCLYKTILQVSVSMQAFLQNQQVNSKYTKWYDYPGHSAHHCLNVGAINFSEAANSILKMQFL